MNINAILQIVMEIFSGESARFIILVALAQWVHAMMSSVVYHVPLGKNVKSAGVGKNPLENLVAVLKQV